MARFLKDTDYDDQIKSEIRRLIDGSTPTTTSNTKLLAAELKAIAQIRNWIGGRYDCNAIFTAHSTGEDLRNHFIVMIAVDMALYHLYSQTPNKDVPIHRKERYQDAIDWIQKASTGDISANDLPSIMNDDDNKSNIRIFSKSTPENHEW